MKQNSFQPCIPVEWDTHCNVYDDPLFSKNGVRLTCQNLDVRNLLEIATNLYNVVWNSPSPSAPTNDHLQDVITKRNLEPDLAAFCLTFTNLLFLSSPDAIKRLEGDIAKLLTNIWDGDMRNEDLSHWMEEVWFADITHLYIEYDIQAPFMTLYSIYLRGSVNSNAAFARRTRVSESARAHSLQCTR